MFIESDVDLTTYAEIQSSDREETSDCRPSEDAEIDDLFEVRRTIEALLASIVEEFPSEEVEHSVPQSDEDPAVLEDYSPAAVLTLDSDSGVIPANSEEEHPESEVIATSAEVPQSLYVIREEPLAVCAYPLLSDS